MLVVGNRELSGFISMALELISSCFPTTSSRSISLEDFAIGSKRTNKVFVAFKLTISDCALRQTVLHPVPLFDLGQ